MTTEKIIMVDRIPEKLSDEEMKKIKDEYAAYCVQTYNYVQGLAIPNKDGKDMVFDHILSPFQYFIEDKVRIRRLNAAEEQLKQKAPVQAQASNKLWQDQPVNKPVQGQNTLVQPINKSIQAQDKPKWKNRF